MQNESTSARFKKLQISVWVVNWFLVLPRQEVHVDNAGQGSVVVPVVGLSPGVGGGCVRTGVGEAAVGVGGGCVRTGVGCGAVTFVVVVGAGVCLVVVVGAGVALVVVAADAMVTVFVSE